MCTPTNTRYCDRELVLRRYWHNVVYQILPIAMEMATAVVALPIAVSMTTKKDNSIQEWSQTRRKYASKTIWWLNIKCVFSVQKYRNSTSIHKQKSDKLCWYFVLPITTFVSTERFFFCPSTCSHRNSIFSSFLFLLTHDAQRVWRSARANRLNVNTIYHISTAYWR